MSISHQKQTYVYEFTLEDYDEMFGITKTSSSGDYTAPLSNPLKVLKQGQG